MLESGRRMPIDKLHRRSLRLKGYDYSQPGAYFVTLVAHARLCVFGEVQDETMCLSRAGQIVKIMWELLPNYFPIRLDEWIIMPNHFHGIIVIEGADPRTPVGIGRGESGGNDTCFPQLTTFPPDSPLPDSRTREPMKESAGLRPDHISHGSTHNPTGAGRPAGTAPGSLGAIIQKFKAMITHRINALQKTPGGIVWQRNYYEHVIRDEKEWERIRLYIQVNPLRWAEDDENPSVIMR